MLDVHIPQDATGFLCASALMVGLVEALKALAVTGLYPSTLTRKLLHIAAGPVFLLTWPWFGSTESTKWWASAVPLTMTAKFALTGLGVIRQESEVQLMSRTGQKEDLLRGPLLYGLVFTVATFLGFRTITAAGSLAALCAGDGMADIIGRRYGETHKLPWSPRKSWAGSAAFVTSAFAASFAFALLFHEWGWAGSATPSELVLPLLAASVASAAAESLPMPDIDNVVAPLCFALALRSLAPGAS
jgi:dolichol kinase